ncbi:MAG: zinc-ribbon domain-containing protein [Candidatus Bathyarchaeota archaeon]|nr:zinc-ribbon domain-containing protein [Candidatus Bathyarchaeum sp.]
MVYCSKCGTKNDDTALYCVNCGTKLDGSPKSWDKRLDEGAEEFGKRMEEWGENFGKQFEEGECFGLHHGGLPFGLIIGILIIIVGILTLAGIEFWSSFWAIIIIMFGLLILGGTIYNLTRKH